MSPKIISVLALAVLLAASVCVVSSAVEGDAEDGMYGSQLDENGQGLLDHLEEALEDLVDDPVDTAVFSYRLSPVFFSTAGEAQQYAKSLVRDAVAACYLECPLYPWLWDVPLVTVDADVVTSEATVTIGEESSVYQTAVSVSFQLSVPADFADDPETEGHDAVEAMRQVISAVEAYEGTVEDKVSSINDRIRGISSKDDEEGTVSNIYDALVTGTSSSAGVAAAFTYMCSVSGVDAVTVAGQVLSDSEGNTETGYWNIVIDDGKRYAVDSTWNSSERRNCLLVGNSTMVTTSSGTERFSATHVADLGSTLATGLEAPSISTSGVSWPDDRSFLDKYGLYVIMSLIVLVIVVVLVHAVRTGNV